MCSASSSFFPFWKKKEKEKEGISQGIQLSERTGSERLGRRRRRRYIRTSGDMGEEETEREKERMEGWASYRTRLWESVVIRPVISSARWCRRETMAGKYSYREQQSHGWQQQQQEPQKERKGEEEEPTWVNYQTGLSFWWEKERVRRNIFLSFPSTGTLYLYIYIIVLLYKCAVSHSSLFIRSGTLSWGKREIYIIQPFSLSVKVFLFLFHSKGCRGFL